MDNEEFRRLAKSSAVLVVDDMAHMRKMIGGYLSEMGFAFPAEAKDGEEALAILCQERPKYNIAIIDSELPVMSGEECLKQIRTNDDVAQKNIPIIMMTGLASQDELIRFAKHGIQGYLAKPLSALKLKQSLERILSGQVENAKIKKKL